MKASQCGEFALIDILAGKVARSKALKRAAPNLLAGIGDDAAVWESSHPVQIATVDSLVEGIHFTASDITWEELGWKAMAVNLSDIAAMGGAPQYALVALALPGDTTTAAVSGIYRGLLEAGDRFDTAIAGGNVSAASQLSITVTVFGGLDSPAWLSRSTAQPGDCVAVTGYLGASAAGLKVLKESTALDSEASRLLREAHVRPQPRVAEGQTLLKQGVKTAIDISDGLVSDLRHVCRMSRVGARVSADLVPVHPQVKAAFREALDMALGGGEDYELLFTAPRALVQRVRRGLACPVTIIGRITEEDPGEVTVVDASGRALAPGPGWEHFRPGLKTAG